MKTTRSGAVRLILAAVFAVGGLAGVLARAQGTAAATSLAPAPAATKPAATQRANLLPNGTRWQELPGDVHYVVFDKSGKPWFETGGKASVEEIRAQVEQSRDLKAPAIRGATIVLFDSKKRLWLIPRDKPGTLLCYDIAANHWTERTTWQDPDAPADSHDHDFRGDALESKKGIVYITGLRGVYTLDGDTWKYQPFYEINVEKGIYYDPHDKSYNPIHFTESPDGIVYAWSPWGMPSQRSGTLGCWRHDGKTWRQLYMGLGIERTRGRLNQVACLGADHLLVATGNHANAESTYIFSTGPAFEKEAQQAITDLSNDDPAVQEKAERKIQELGLSIIPKLTQAVNSAADADAKTRLETILHSIDQSPKPTAMLDGLRLFQSHVLGRDGQDNLYVFANTALLPDGKRSPAFLFRFSPDGKLTPAPAWMHISAQVTPTRRGHTLFFEYEKGLAILDGDKITALTGPTDAAYTQLLGEDDEGRFYIMSDPLGSPDAMPHPANSRIVLLDPRLPDTRPTLPSQIYPASNFFVAIALDSNDRLWMQFSRKEHPFFSYFENGAWHDLPLPADSPKFTYLGYLQPLTGGGLVARSDDFAAGFIYSGNQWRPYPSIDKMVESEFALLQKTLSNETRKVPRPFLSKDSAGNIWVLDFDNTRVYTGKEWVRMADSPDKPIVHVGRIYPAEGNNMFVIGWNEMGYAQVKDGKIRINRPNALKLDLSAASFGNDYGLHVDSHNRTWLRVAQQKVVYLDEKGPHDVPGSPMNPMLEDREGRIWFLNPLTRKISVLLADGRSAEFPAPTLYAESCLAQDKANSLWLTTTHGLAHYTVADADGKITLTKVAEYTAGLPAGTAHGLWVDATGNLWLLAYGLWRIEIKQADMHGASTPH